MALLAGTCYDPGTAVSKATTAAANFAAFDTTNLRLAFTAPANGNVLVRMRGVQHGATTFADITFGVMSGASVIAQHKPLGALSGTALATSQLVRESLFTVTGLTPGNSYTWDAAYAIAGGIASTGIKYGGPNNTTTNDAWGGFQFEVWEAPTLISAVNYNPAGAVTKVTTSRLAITALDTTNLRITNWTVPASGEVLVRLRGVLFPNATPVWAQILFGVLEGSTVKGRAAAIGGLHGEVAARISAVHEAQFLVTGLTPAASLTWDAAWGVEILTATSGALAYGGGEQSDGSFAFEIWSA